MTLTVFGEIERFVADLYPYRYVITPLLAVLAVGAVVLAVRQGLHLVLLRHRLATTAVGVPLLALALIAGNYLLSPLWERSSLHEASPIQAAVSQPDAAMTGPEMPATTEAKVTRSGMFKGADSFHFGRGDALIIMTGPGRNLLRLENFSVQNGPDLYIYLSKDEAGRQVDEALNLGRLKATDGAFNYEIPAAISLDGVKSVVVWCRQFGVLFAVAPLMEG